MSALHELLQQALHANHHSLPEETQDKLVRYLKLIQTWNRVFNLTSIVAPRDMVYLHLIDSLTIHPYLHGSRLLDVGSGAGLPGIPLAIIHPDQHWTLLDKNSKKTRFMTQVIAELGLKNAEAVHARCEDFHPAACFDSIVSRAFGTLRLFVETTEHLLCHQGLFVAMKGKYPQEEIDDLPATVTLQTTKALVINGINVERQVICLSKK